MQILCLSEKVILLFSFLRVNSLFIQGSCLERIQMPLGTEVKLHKVFGKLIIWVIPNIQMFEVVWKTQDSQKPMKGGGKLFHGIPSTPVECPWHLCGIPVVSLWNLIAPPPWHPLGTPWQLPPHISVAAPWHHT